MQVAPVSKLCSHTLTSMHYRETNLVDELIGQKTFVEVMLMQVLNRTPRPVDVRITDAVLIVLMEHGLTPSAIATRLIYMSAPENLQGAVAAGLLAVGSQFVGTMENCAKLLDRIGAATDPHVEARAIALQCKTERSAVPGFGHHLHKPVDPRAYKLLDLARAERDLKGDHLRALDALSGAVDDLAGRPITINATGAVAALLGEIGVPSRLMRGFAVVSRAAGLVSHIAEEQVEPSARFIWDTIDRAMTSHDVPGLK